MSPELLEIACTCCESPCPPSGYCPGNAFIQRIACGGASQFSTVVDLSGGYTSDWFYGTSSAFPRPSRLRLAIDLSTPSIAPGPQAGSDSPFGGYTWEGYYQKLMINDVTSEFDGTFGTGVEATPDVELATLSGTSGVTGSLDAESMIVSTLTQATPGWEVNAGGSATLSRSWKGTYSDSGTTVPYLMNQTIENATAGVLNRGYVLPAGALCGGSPQNGTLERQDGGGATVGGWSAQLVLPDSIGLSAEDFAARTCPCSIQVGGQLWVKVRTDTGKPIVPDDPPYSVESVYVAPSEETEGGWTDPEPMTADKIAWAAATLDARIVRSDGAGCGTGVARWDLGSTAATLNVGGVGYAVSTVQARRLGPRLYRLEVAIEGVETNDGDGSNVETGTQTVTLYVATDNDCPTNVQDTQQFAQAHYYGPATADTTSKTLIPVNPSVGSPFTENAISLEEVARETGDPACGCHEVADYGAEGDAEAFVAGVLAEDVA